MAQRDLGGRVCSAALSFQAPWRFCYTTYCPHDDKVCTIWFHEAETFFFLSISAQILPCLRESRRVRAAYTFKSVSISAALQWILQTWKTLPDVTIAQNCMYRVCIKKVKNTVHGKHPFTYLFRLNLIYLLNSVCKNHKYGYCCWYANDSREQIKKWVRAVSNVIGSIPSHSVCQTLANFSGVEFEKTVSKFRKGGVKSSSFVHLHKT